MPGVQRNRGPHGITLAGARAQRRARRAAEVLKYLESLGDADPRYTDLPLSDAEQAAIVGEYAFGPGATERLKVVKNARGVLTHPAPRLHRARTRRTRAAWRSFLPARRPSESDSTS